MNKTNLAFYEFVLNKWCNLSTYLDPDLDPHFEFGSWSSNSLNNDRDQKPCPWHISTTVIQGVGAREKIFIGERMENISVDRLKPISEVPPPPSTWLSFTSCSRSGCSGLRSPLASSGGGLLWRTWYSNIYRVHLSTSELQEIRQPVHMPRESICRII